MEQGMEGSEVSNSQNANIHDGTERGMVGRLERVQASGMEMPRLAKRNTMAVQFKACSQVCKGSHSFLKVLALKPRELFDYVKNGRCLFDRQIHQNYLNLM
ncbi:hypothetical protein FGO68_gene17805 [Halteria grandinella]|uniref:Uncharacterized protein n=1 Tax=Halteria grandinella TaxID=5974 RepID=A0A8J8P1E2_HALGN|nr:hypothetical protein FGO68_gene17805 [Halteria grandinella]